MWLTKVSKTIASDLVVICSLSANTRKGVKFLAEGSDPNYSLE